MTINLNLRRSSLYREHVQNEAQFDGALVSHYVDIQSETATAKALAICDLSGAMRIGFKGSDTPAWLSGQGLALPELPNTASQGARALIAKLSYNEFLIVDRLHADESLSQQLRDSWSMDLEERTYLLERADSHACFAITGQHAPAALAKVCAVDMRLHKFAQLSVAQTSVARVNSVVVRADQGVTPCFLVLADQSCAEFMWHGLLDAMQEFAGKAIGVAALGALAND